MKRLTASFLLLLASFAAGFAQNPVVEFLHMTDIHVTDLGTAAKPLAAARDHFRETGDNFAKFLSGTLSGTQRPQGSEFILITGDLVDGFSFVTDDGRRLYGQIDAFQRAIARAPVPLYLLLGNHDLSHYGLNAVSKPAADQSVAGEARAAWAAAHPSLRGGTYYSIERTAGGTKYVILALDNGYSAAGSPENPGFLMAHEQLYWIRRQLERHAGAAIIIAMHVPLESNAASETIKTALSGAKNVALILAGHVHRDGVDRIPFDASEIVQVRTAAFGYGVNHWRRILLHPDRIEVFATGKHDQVETTVTIRQPGS